MTGSTASDYFDKMMTTLAPRDQEVAAEIFRYLVAPSGRRVAHTAQDLAAYTGIAEDDVLHTLEELMFLRVVHGPLGEARTYEVFDPSVDVVGAILNWQSRHTTRRPAAARPRRWHIRWRRRA